MATKTLNTEVRHFTATLGEKTLADRRQQRHQLVCFLLCFTFSMQRDIQLHGGEIAEHTTTFHQRFLGQQHAPHIRVDNDRIGRFIRIHSARRCPHL